MRSMFTKYIVLTQNPHIQTWINNSKKIHIPEKVNEQLT